ncbi:MAG: phosphodiester glycosidase family protein [Oscillospiraceae bacterium]|nr:phosphodiester glycosidase family protein [Oscillospiraceae bacterium]
MTFLQKLAAAVSVIGHVIYNAADKLLKKLRPVHGKREASGKAAASKKPTWQRVVLTVLAVLVALEACYAVAVYSKIPLIARLRTAYIQTAMSTMRHQWLATSFFPKNVIDEVMAGVRAAEEGQIGVNSEWGGTGGKRAIYSRPEMTPEEREFYSIFWEIEPTSFSDYLSKHPEALANGWANLYINEAGLEKTGTSIQTVEGDQVLAIDALNKIILIRVSGSGYRGVLAIAKDPAQLSVKMSASLPGSGQTAGVIGAKNGGVLAMTASGFIDVDAEGNVGKGNGGILAGYTMSDGIEHGKHMGWGNKRIELHADDRFYIRDVNDPVSSSCTDAVEFTPAMIVDGRILVDENCGWNAINPRACIGQTDLGEIMMLGIEGRQIQSLGTGVVECAAILSRYHCAQAMNLDGGTSAIMWYQGEYVIRCSNLACPYGRTLPNAFVYAGKRLDG